MGTPARLGAIASPPASHASATARLDSHARDISNPPRPPPKVASKHPASLLLKFAEISSAAAQSFRGWKLGMEGGDRYKGVLHLPHQLWDTAAWGLQRRGGPTLPFSPTSRNSPPGGPTGVLLGKGLMERPRKAGNGWQAGGAARARTYSSHTSNPPWGDTKNSSATPAKHPAGRRPPTPAPRATKEVTLSGQPWRGSWASPSAEARRAADP